MSRSRHQPAAVCGSCGRPVKDATLCTKCVGGVARDLGDVAALTQDVARAFSADDRTKGSDDRPLVRSRARRRVPRVDLATLSCPVDPVTGGPVLELEPLRAGEFGRSPSTSFDADHGLGREIEATVARQTATARREGGRSTVKPMPFNESAAKVAARVHNTLGGWVRDLHDGTEVWPRDDVGAFAAWLLARLDRIAVHPAAVELERDVTRVVEQLRRAVDRPADLWWLGPCATEDCLTDHLLVDDDGRSRTVRRPTELYAEPDAESVACRNCGATYLVEDRRAYLLAMAEDQLAHAELIGRAAPALGVDITPAAVRGYALRKRIVAHGTDLQGRPLYRLGDVIDVARDVLTRRSEQVEKRRAEAAAKAEKAAARARSA